MPEFIYVVTDQLDKGKIVDMLDKYNGWIKVSDKLPPIDRPVLFIIEDGSQHVGYPRVTLHGIGNSSFQYEVGGWTNCCYCGGISKIYCIDGFRDDKKAVWWMELSKGPVE